MKSKLNRFHFSFIGFYGFQFFLSSIPSLAVFVFMKSQPIEETLTGSIHEPVWFICALLTSLCFIGQIYYNQDDLRRIEKKIRKYSNDGTHWFTEYQIQRELQTLAANHFQLKDLSTTIHQVGSSLRVTLAFTLLGDMEDSEIHERKKTMETSLREGFGLQEVEIELTITKSVTNQYH